MFLIHFSDVLIVHDKPKTRLLTLIMSLEQFFNFDYVTRTVPQHYLTSQDGKRHLDVLRRVELSAHSMYNRLLQPLRFAVCRPHSPMGGHSASGRVTHSRGCVCSRNSSCFATRQIFPKKELHEIKYQGCKYAQF
jgi:hypothetical protein